MTIPKLQNVWAALRAHLLEEKIPHAMIGALALSQYGVVRYTADIDLLMDFQDKQKIMQMMETLIFDCFHVTGYEYLEDICPTFRRPGTTGTVAAGLG
ncbi:MAG: hypothetical protein SWH68_11050 [Thermodesulfobacteriota bacterium]|nr:hypothetical protein [Thermodesulfobacteriota bacterium]